MIEVIKVALSAMDIISSMEVIILQRNSPELLQAYNPALGGYIIQIEITSNTQVSCRCKHAP